MLPFLKKKSSTDPDLDLVSRVAAEAEQLYRSGTMHCAEAVLYTVTKAFRPERAEGIAALASGFGGGSGTGCICGAIAGGTVAFGVVLEDKGTVKRLTKELHGWFSAEYGATCCRTILKTHGKICAGLTGKVAGKVAALLMEKM